MLRILHSLPRAHKLLLLPVATMVTVLGTHKLIASFDTADEGHETQTRVSLDFLADAQAQQPANNASIQPTDFLQLDATRQAVPLTRLTPSEVVDISAITSAKPQTLPLKRPQPASIEGEAASASESLALESEVLHLAMFLPEQNDEAFAGGTSYEDLSSDPLILDDGDTGFEGELAAQTTFVPEWETYTVQKGDTFAVMAERTLGLGYREVLGLLEQFPDEDQAVLTRWRVGDSFDFKLDESGDLLALRIMKNARLGYLIERSDEDERFEVADFEKASEATQRLYAGTVSGSFARSAEATGLSNGEVAELSALLSKKLDFRRDTRRGDQFQVLVEADMIEGQAMDSRILAAKYQGERMDLIVVRNTADNRFYTPEGHSLDPAFNRHPFHGDYRISSSFNLRRKHPITGRISPHRGTDFAMHTGTPVLSPADGRVIKATYQSLAGNYLVIRHDNGYKTRYMHLSKHLVSEGERVEMGQKIALSGNTGRSTGPHLHYEVMVNNNQVNPMRVKLPESQSLSGKALDAFKQESEQLLAKLENNHNGAVLASRSIPQPRPEADGG